MSSRNQGGDRARLMSRLARMGFIDTRRTGNPVRRKVRSRGVPPALANNEIFYTENVREAGSLLSQALAPGWITLPDGATGFAATMHGVRLRNVSMLYLDLHVRSTLEIPALGRYFGVHMPMNGTARCVHNGHDFEANTINALVTSPGAGLTMHFDDDSPQLLIRIEEQALHDYLTRMRGRRLSGPLVFHPEFDLTSDVAVRWHAAVQLLHTEVYHSGSLVQLGHGISGIEELLMNSLLHIQPSNYYEEFIRPAGDPRRRVVAEAMNYIDTHLAEPITMESIARHVHMSIRSIQQGFREELGVSPMTYVRDRRLERVHAELADALPSDRVTVTDVATRWGFNHLGSFAVEYRKRWGTTPSETLRQ
ncbi:AraC family transcriptional regulator [Mycolicibacterium moriokaense]|nr:AraC family transcriptional regulator [Mycolicibacterium moriokaense]